MTSQQAVQHPIILYRVFNPDKQHYYFKTEKEAEGKAISLSKAEPDNVFSVDVVTSKNDIRQAILDVFLDVMNFWWRTTVLSYWENGERYGVPSRESPATEHNT